MNHRGRENTEDAQSFVPKLCASIRFLVAVLLCAALPGGNDGAGRAMGARAAAEGHPAVHARGGVPRANLDPPHGGRPLCFEANLRQADSRVRFLSRLAGRSLFLTPTEIVFGPAPSGTPDPERGPGAGAADAAVRMRFAGANPQPRVAGLDEAPARVSSFIGSDPRRWQAGVPTYRRVAYGDLYPGVDAVFYGNGEQLEYDFLVAPGADPGLIDLEVGGAGRLLVDGNGDLVVRSSGGAVRQQKPTVYQWEAGAKRVVAGRYVLRGERRVGFEIGAYDATKPLVIDPVVAFSTFLGGDGIESVGAVEVDAAGNVYVTGWTASADFPVSGPVQGTNGGGEFDIFVTKPTPEGAVVFSTYLGGVGRRYGPRFEEGRPARGSVPAGRGRRDTRRQP